MAEPPLTPPLHEPPPPGADHQQPEDFPVKTVVKFTLWFVGVTVVIHVIVLLYLYVLSGMFSGTQQGPQSAKDLTEQQVPLPRQGDPFASPGRQLSDAADLKILRDQEQEKLEGYHWVDRKDGVVHIPIERAIDLLANTKTAASHGIQWQARPSGTVGGKAGKGKGKKAKGAGP